MNYVVLYRSNELYHHGIEGQKWGDKNGPPYPIQAGKHSAAEKKANPSLVVKKAVKAVGNTIKRAANWKRLHTITGRPTKNPRHLTDAELKARVDRLKTEEEFRKLSGVKTKQQKTEVRIAAGKAFAVSFMNKLGGRVGSIGETLGKMASNQMLKDRDEKFIREEKNRKYYEEKTAAKKAKKEYDDYADEVRKEAKEKRKQYRQEVIDKANHGKDVVEDFFARNKDAFD